MGRTKAMIHIHIYGGVTLLVISSVNVIRVCDNRHRAGCEASRGTYL